MIYQMRTYTIGSDKIDEFMKFFKETNVPIMQKYGLKLEGAWVNEARNQVVWIRSANDADDLKAKETQLTQFLESAEWKEATAHARGMVARMEVQIVDPVNG